MKRRKLTKTHNFEYKYPLISKQWNYKKNIDIMPSMITPGSERKIWWICKKGHEWQTAPYNRTNGKGCPFCANQKTASDNNLKTLRPGIAKEWSYEKNDKLKPKDVVPGSGIKVWWKCTKGHEWETRVTNRLKGTGCPYCGGRKIHNDNCLAVNSPKLALQWNYKKNTGLTPYDVMPGSNKRVWWKCSKRHEWKTSVLNRKSNDCPDCQGCRVCDDNCLQTLKPELAAEWHSSKNGSLNPKDVTTGSRRKVWWQCKKGHEWPTSVCGRSKGYGCPYCASRCVCLDNCLATLNPKVAKEWHPTRNGKLTPYNVTVGSGKKVWWICELGHTWKTAVHNRKRTGCRDCSYSLRAALRSRGGSVGRGIAGELTNKLRRRTKQKSKYLTEKSINYPFKKLPKMKIFDKEK